MKIKIFVTAFLLCMLFSCKKNDKTTSNCDKTVASIAGTYSIIKYEIKLNGAFQDFSNLLETCELDDKLSLNKNGTTIYQDLGTVCSPPRNSTGTWGISPSGKITINDNNGGTADITAADITSFDCTNLILTITNPNTPSDQYRVTLKK